MEVRVSTGRAPLPQEKVTTDQIIVFSLVFYLVIYLVFLHYLIYFLIIYKVRALPLHQIL